MSAIKKENMTQKLIKNIKYRILMKRYQAGDSLPREEDLATEFGVSRPVVREALAILKSQGYLQARRGAQGGTFVKNLLESNQMATLCKDLVVMEQVSFAELGAARLLIEPEAARLAAQNASSMDLRRLEDIVRQPVVQAGDENGFDENFNFHITIADLSGNPFYGMLIRNLMHVVESFLYLYADTKLYEIDARDHLAIFEAIRDRNPQEAYERMYVHTSTVKSIISKAVHPSGGKSVAPAVYQNLEDGL